MDHLKKSPNLHNSKNELSHNPDRTVALLSNSQRQTKSDLITQSSKSEVSCYEKLSEITQNVIAEDQRLRHRLKETEAECIEFQKLFVQADKEVAQLKDVIIKNRREFEDEKAKVETIVREKNKELSQANMERDKEEKKRERVEKQAVRFRLDIEAIREDLKNEKELHKKTEEKNQELCKIIEEQEKRIYHFQNKMTLEYQQNLNVLSEMLQPMKKRKLADNDK